MHTQREQLSEITVIKQESRFCKQYFGDNGQDLLGTFIRENRGLQKWGFLLYNPEKKIEDFIKKQRLGSKRDEFTKFSFTGLIFL